MKKILILTALLFSFIAYAEDKPIKYFYDKTEDRVSIGTKTEQERQTYKSLIDETMNTRDLDIMGDLRTVITLKKPLNYEETIAFLSKYSLKAEQVVIYAHEPSGNIGTMNVTKPSNENIAVAFHDMQSLDNDIIGTVAIYTFIPMQKAKLVHQDEQVFIADFSADRKLHSLRAKLFTNREDKTMSIYEGKRHHIAWDIYSKK